MHQGPTKTYLLGTGISLLLIYFAIPSSCFAQLSSSDEIIETIQDIQIQDDSSSKKKDLNPYKPQYDEEFGEKQPVQEEPEQMDSYESEENIAEPESSPQEQKVERKEISDEEKKSYENELEKNARKNRFEKREISPEDQKRFEVDAVPVEVSSDEPAQDPVVASPEEQKAQDSEATEDPLEEELSQAEEETPQESPEEESVVTEEKPGPAIYYPPEESGPVISYKNEKTISREEKERLSEKTKVEIEEDPYVEGTLSKKIGDYLKPYKERRPSWTMQAGAGMNQYIPMNYASDIAGDDFELSYEDSKVPSPEFNFELKKNFSFAAIAAGFEFAYYKTSNEVTDFTLTMPSLKATLYLDTLFNEPYVVPYGSIGFTYMMYDEAPTDGSEGFKGKTDNMFVSLGALFQLDWLDPAADAKAYSDVGIENTFVYVEARTYLDQGIARKEGDADFSSDTHIAGGVKLEF